MSEARVGWRSLDEAFGLRNSVGGYDLAELAELQWPHSGVAEGLHHPPNTLMVTLPIAMGQVPVFPANTHIGKAILQTHGVPEVGILIKRWGFFAELQLAFIA